MVVGCGVFRVVVGGLGRGGGCRTGRVGQARDVGVGCMSRRRDWGLGRRLVEGGGAGQRTGERAVRKRGGALLVVHEIENTTFK